jgi:hypothetical protein
MKLVRQPAYGSRQHSPRPTVTLVRTTSAPRKLMRQLPKPWPKSAAAPDASRSRHERLGPRGKWATGLGLRTRISLHAISARFTLVALHRVGVEPGAAVRLRSGHSRSVRRGNRQARCRSSTHCEHGHPNGDSADCVARPGRRTIVATAVFGEAEVLCTLDRDLFTRQVLDYCHAHRVEVLTDRELMERLKR